MTSQISKKGKAAVFRAPHVPFQLTWDPMDPDLEGKYLLLVIPKLQELLRKLITD